MASVLYRFPVTCLYLLTVAREKEDPNDQYGYERLQRFGRLQRCATCPPIPSLISFVNMSAPEAQAAAAGHRAGNRNYSKDEVMNFLYVMKDILPIGPDEWQCNVDNHTLLYEGRDVDSIRRKFASLHRRQIPTGDPAMPEEVRLAKHVNYLIGDKANIGDALALLRPPFSIQWWLTARPNSTRSSVPYAACACRLWLLQSASDNGSYLYLVLVVLHGRPLTPILMTGRCRAFYLHAMAGCKSQRDAPLSRCHRQLHLRLFEASEKHNHRHISCDNNRQRICERDVE